MNASLQLLHHVLPSVVHLKATVPEDHLSTRVLGAERMGSGTIVDSAGLVLTVNYVTIGASDLEVTLFDGRTVAGRVVAHDFVSGITVLSIPGNGHRPAPLRPSVDVRPGEEVFLVSTVADGGRRASSGALCAVESFDATWEYVLERALMATVANPGLGGGPMFDHSGRMVGVASLNLAEIGKLSLAIPVENYLDHRQEILRHGRIPRQSRAWIGLFCHVLNGHVVIGGILPGSPADKGGLRPGDVVVAVDDVPVEDRRAFYRQIWTHRSGESVRIRVFRDGETVHLDVPTGNIEELMA